MLACVVPWPRGLYCQLGTLPATAAPRPGASLQPRSGSAVPWTELQKAGQPCVVVVIVTATRYQH